MRDFPAWNFGPVCITVYGLTDSLWLCMCVCGCCRLSAIISWLAPGVAYQLCYLMPVLSTLCCQIVWCYSCVEFECLWSWLSLWILSLLSHGFCCMDLLGIGCLFESLRNQEWLLLSCLVYSCLLRCWDFSINCHFHICYWILIFGQTGQNDLTSHRFNKCYGSARFFIQQQCTHGSSGGTDAGYGMGCASLGSVGVRAHYPTATAESTHCTTSTASSLRVYGHRTSARATPTHTRDICWWA